jgi:hypothetical protein
MDAKRKSRLILGNDEKIPGSRAKPGSRSISSTAKLSPEWPTQ